MSNITYEAVEQYMYSMLPERHAVLLEIEEQALQRNIPIVGPAVGGLLHVLAQTSGAKRVFECGSAVGYSTIWWALAIGKEGRVVYTDSDPKKAAEAHGYFERVGVAERIEIRVGDALAALESEKPESFDIIFNDVDKQFYPQVLPLAIPRLKRGGLFITDNVLWSGKVTDPKTTDASTRAIQEFNRLLPERKELFTSIVPIRDGVAVARKS